MSKRQKQKISELTDHIGYWMRLVSNDVSHAFAKKLEASGVTVAEWVVLREIFNTRTTSPSAMAELTGLTRGAVSKLVNRLFEKALVTREEAAVDRRYQTIQLTAKGIQLVPILAAIADENDKAFFSGLSKNERNQLTDLLKKLVELHQLKTAPIE